MTTVNSSTVNTTAATHAAAATSLPKSGESSPAGDVSHLEKEIKQLMQEMMQILKQSLSGHSKEGSMPPLASATTQPGMAAPAGTASPAQHQHHHHHHAG
ncbi:hypothetical protein [Pandoraea anhela]|uniref:Uncharacterized protein n=1 Tax=Pandoraea anhela TaxID=2508295 RepID=A0A5E4YQX5_9BURK|nr:hypothetical protein [Pandoraea anhela]VVE50758.1 hypothetical protein PAN31108_04685 [Pandoraea anhela]